MGAGHEGGQRGRVGVERPIGGRCCRGVDGWVSGAGDGYGGGGGEGDGGLRRRGTVVVEQALEDVAADSDRSLVGVHVIALVDVAHPHAAEHRRGGYFGGKLAASAASICSI